MKKFTLLFSILLLIAVSFSNAKAQDQEMMKRWMEYSTPGQQHTSMSKAAGDWKFTSKMWMDPTQEPMVTDGSAKFESIYGGRYLQCKVSGSMMGMPFEGTSLTGYNNATKKYFNTWIDNMGTGLMFTEGTADASGVISLTGSMYDPMSGKNCTIRETWRMDGDNKMTMEMYSTKEGESEKKDMEIVYTR
jgi:hypothetical protein